MRQGNRGELRELPYGADAPPFGGEVSSIRTWCEAMQRVVVSGVGRSLTRMLSCSVRAKAGTLYEQLLSCTDLTTQQTNKTCLAHDQNAPETDRLRVGSVRLLIEACTLRYSSAQVANGR